MFLHSFEFQGKGRSFYGLTETYFSLKFNAYSTNGYKAAMETEGKYLLKGSEKVCILVFRKPKCDPNSLRLNWTIFSRRLGSDSRVCGGPQDLVFSSRRKVTQGSWELRIRVHVEV